MKVQLPRNPSHQDWADYERRNAAQHYRRARRDERYAAEWEKAAVNHDWLARWFDRNPQEDDAAAQAAAHRNSAESFRQLAAQYRDGVPRAREYAREATARAKRYQVLADKDAARVAEWKAEQEERSTA